MSSPEEVFKFDFSISFASEDQELAYQLDKKLRAGGANVFFYPRYQSHLHGKRLSHEFPIIFGPATRFFVPLISKHYIKKPWPMHEWESALREREKGRYDFILPIRIDDTMLPGLYFDTLFLDVRQKNIDSICKSLLETLSNAKPHKAHYTHWVATFGISVFEVVKEWELIEIIPDTYAEICDWFDNDLKQRLSNFANIEKLNQVEDFRNGETLSIRYEFRWSPDKKPLNFGPLDWWEVLEVEPFESIYPETSQTLV